MSEDVVEGIGKTSADGFTQRHAEMVELQRAVEAETVQGAEFSKIAEQAIAKAVERPSTEDGFRTETSGLMGPGEGAVGLEKNGLISDVTRPGVAPKPEQTADVQAETEERVRELYVELTNYQIAWKIAQRIQTDTTQLLRGS